MGKGELGIFEGTKEVHYNGMQTVSRQNVPDLRPYSRGGNEDEENDENEKTMMTKEQGTAMNTSCRMRSCPAPDGRRRGSTRWPNTVHRMTGLGQLVLQGHKRQVQGSNGLNPAQPCLSWGFDPNPSVEA